MSSPERQHMPATTDTEEPLDITELAYEQTNHALARAERGADPGRRTGAACQVGPVTHAQAELRGDPDWEALGDLTSDTAVRLARLAGGMFGVSQEAVRDKMQVIADECAGSDSTPLERLLADRVGICWGHLALAESDLLRRRDSGSIEVWLADHLERRQERAHRRYLQAVKALAQVRKLLGPSVTQVNIAENQVNVAG